LPPEAVISLVVLGVNNDADNVGLPAASPPNFGRIRQRVAELSMIWPFSALF